MPTCDLMLPRTYSTWRGSTWRARHESHPFAAVFLADQALDRAGAATPRARRAGRSDAARHRHHACGSRARMRQAVLARMTMPAGVRSDRGPGQPSQALYHHLARDLSTLQIDHRRAEYFRPVGVRTALRESETVSDRHTGFDFVSHVASADILEIGGDVALALAAYAACSVIIPIDHLKDGIVGIQTGKRGGLAPLDRAPQARDSDGF